MAGVKGRSGGARPGSGRKPKLASLPPPEAAMPAGGTGVEFLRSVMHGQIIPTIPQLEAAKVLARLEAAPASAGGKKDAAKEAAKKASLGKFRAADPPKLVVSNG